MRFAFHDIKDFERKYSNYYPVDQCSYGNLKEMDITQAVFEIGDKQISVYESMSLS